MINLKKTIVYGINRYQKDFEYMFPKANVIAYITDSKNNKECNGKKCYSINEIPNKLKKYTLIICNRKNEKIDKIVKNLNFKKAYYLEDIAYLLDDNFMQFSVNFMGKHFNEWGCVRYKPNSECFKEMIYTDSIDNIKCDYPFRYAQIQPGGYVYTCCSNWTTMEVGNIFFVSPKKLWNSNSAKLHRLAIINKTYFFCNFDVCPFIKKSFKKTDTRFENLTTSKYPNEVCVSIDRSCNLKCPSCRNSFCNYNGAKYKITKHLANKIIKSGWATKSKHFIMSSQGEVFFSKIYKKMLFDSKITNRDYIKIHTNGTLLTKKTLDKLCAIYDKRIEFLITIDAATKQTYEKIRFGGNFDQLMKNLENLSKVKNENPEKIFVLLFFVVQKDNYKEIPDFIKMADELNFDMVNFTRIDNWGTYTDEEFKEISMFNKDGTPKKELQEILKNSVFKDKKRKVIVETNELIR